jgi:hypothetical protein
VGCQGRHDSKMTDLEKLIRDQQDELRGRPRDWIDDFGDWRRRDGPYWPAILVITLCLAWLVFAWVMIAAS